MISNASASMTMMVNGLWMHSLASSNTRGRTCVKIPWRQHPPALEYSPVIYHKDRGSTSGRTVSLCQRLYHVGLLALADSDFDTTRGMRNQKCDDGGITFSQKEYTEHLITSFCGKQQMLLSSSGSLQERALQCGILKPHSQLQRDFILSEENHLSFRRTAQRRAQPSCCSSPARIRHVSYCALVVAVRVYKAAVRRRNATDSAATPPAPPSPAPSSAPSTPMSQRIAEFVGVVVSPFR